MTRTPQLLTAFACWTCVYIALGGFSHPTSSAPTTDNRTVSPCTQCGLGLPPLTNENGASSQDDTAATAPGPLRYESRIHKRTVPFLLPFSYQPTSRPSAHEEHDKAAASSIFRNLLRLSVSKANTSNGPVSVPQELTFHEGQTIATIYTKAGEDSVHCNLIEVLTPEESDRVLKMFALQNRRVLKTSFRTILAIITACQALDPDTAPDGKREESNSFAQFTTFATTTGRTESMDRAVSAEHLNSKPQATPNPPEMWSVISGILPGTKWCGLGDIAKDYHDLGAEKNLDKCCRAHDHCPTKLKALRSGYGLVNWSFYTKSHCECDSLLFDCLKKATNPTADMLGNFYFNILKVQCIDEEEPKKCAVYDEVTHQCRSWQPNSELSTQKRMFFRNIPREF